MRFRYVLPSLFQLTIFPFFSVENWDQKPLHKLVQVVAKGSVAWSVALIMMLVGASLNRSLLVAYEGLQDTETYRDGTCYWINVVHSS